jgi:hypothetical protein
VNELHDGLKAEIEFWQGLIIESDSSIHSIEVKRMVSALEFAQMKLLKYEHDLTGSVSELSKH